MQRSTLVTLTLITVITALALGAALYVRHARLTAERDVARQVLVPAAGVAAYTDLTGEPVSLDDYTGRPLIVNAWASWSPFSVSELPALAALARDFEASGVAVLAINRSESKEQAERFLRSVGDTAGLTLILDPDDHFYRSVGGYAMPETVFYTADGEVFAHRRGVVSAAELRQTLEALLAVPN